MRELTPDYIRDKLLWLGFSPANKGFQYITEAEMIIEEDPNAMYNITKQIYRTLGKKYGYGWTAIERSIRQAISSAMSVVPEKVEDYLQYPVSGNKSMYKNSDFLTAFHIALHREKD